MYKAKGPCDCGAEDCIRCFPENFRNGKYVGDEEETEDEGDGLAYIPEAYADEDDGSYYSYCYPDQ